MGGRFHLPNPPSPTTMAPVDTSATPTLVVAPSEQALVEGYSTIVDLLVETIDQGPQDPTNTTLATMKGWQARFNALLQAIAALGKQFERFGYVLPVSVSERVIKATDTYFTRFDEFHTHLLAN